MKRIDETEAQVRDALRELDRPRKLAAKDCDRMIVLAADILDTARRLRERAMRFKQPALIANDNDSR